MNMRLLIAILLFPAVLLSAATPKKAQKSRRLGNSRRSFGQSNNTSANQTGDDTNAGPTLKQDVDAKSVLVPAAPEPSVIDWTWELNSFANYESKPAKQLSSQKDWHWDTEASISPAWRISKQVTLTAQVGQRWFRYQQQHDLESDEPFTGLELAWKFAPYWTLALQHESLWDLVPGYGAQLFASHTTTLHLQFDLPNPSDKSPFTWQFSTDVAHATTHPNEQDFTGISMGAGCEVRLVPERLKLQMSASAAWQHYPHFVLEKRTRQGFDYHVVTALVWSPCAHAEVSVGIEYMRSAENGTEYRFNDITVPLGVKITF
jgi:hypothetical protein